MRWATGRVPDLGGWACDASALPACFGRPPRRRPWDGDRRATPSWPRLRSGALTPGPVAWPRGCRAKVARSLSFRAGRTTFGLRGRSRTIGTSSTSRRTSGTTSRSATAGQTRRSEIAWSPRSSGHDATSPAARSTGTWRMPSASSFYFVGDVRQPLHDIGEARGGNDVRVELHARGLTCMGARVPRRGAMSLHSA
jgi:hypothetical protein